MKTLFKTTAITLFAAASAFISNADTVQWKEFKPGASDLKKVAFTTENDALVMKFTPGTSEQGWGSKGYPLVGRGRTVRLEVDVKAEGCPKSGKTDWAQLSFQGNNAAGRNIKSYNTQLTPLDKLKDWTHLTYTFTIPEKGDKKWDTCVTLMAGISARCSHGAKVMFKNFKYTELPANFVNLENYRPGKGPAGIKAEVKVVDDSIIQVKYLPGSIPGGQAWFSQQFPMPDKGKKVTVSVKARCTNVTDPRAAILFSFQGIDKNNRNVKVYVNKNIPYYTAEKDFVELSHTFTIPQKHAKWDNAVKISASFSCRSANGTFEFKDYKFEYK